MDGLTTVSGSLYVTGTILGNIDIDIPNIIQDESSIRYVVLDSAKNRILRYKSGSYGTYSMTVETPTGAELIPIVYTFVPITVTEIQAVVYGIGSPSVTINPTHGTSIAAATNNILSSPTAITNTTTGQNLTSFSDPTIPADSWIVFKTTAVGVVPLSVTLTIRYIQ